MDFITIDFETATSARDSACAIGIAVVENNIVIHTSKEYIQPPDNEYDEFNVWLHGIGPKQTKNAPTFGALYDKLSGILSGKIVIAHYATFDMSVLRHSCALYNNPFPEFTYLCSKHMATKAWPNDAAYGLEPLTSKLSIPLVHHDPESDAVACAQVVLTILQENGLSSVDEISSKLQIEPGKMIANNYWPCRVNKLKHQQEIRPRDIKATTDCIDHSSAVADRYFVFTGTLASMQRKQAWQKVVDAGGIIGDTVNQKTDYLVLGIQDFKRFVDGEKSNKLRKAEQLAAAGHPIEVISEADFLQMLP